MERESWESLSLPNQFFLQWWALSFDRWFYFRVTGCKGQDLQFRIMNAGQSSFPVAWPNYNACGSYDAIHTFRMPTIYDKEKGILSFKIKSEHVSWPHFHTFSSAQKRNPSIEWNDVNRIGEQFFWPFAQISFWKSIGILSQGFSHTYLFCTKFFIHNSSILYKKLRTEQVCVTEFLLKLSMQHWWRCKKDYGQILTKFIIVDNYKRLLLTIIKGWSWTKSIHLIYTAIFCEIDQASDFLPSELSKSFYPFWDRKFKYIDYSEY